MTTEKKISFKNCLIRVIKYNDSGRVFYYPAFNGNAEFTTYKGVCSYIRRVLRYERNLNETVRYNAWAGINMFLVH